jgi:hypothetical protein
MPTYSFDARPTAVKGMNVQKHKRRLTVGTATTTKDAQLQSQEAVELVSTRQENCLQELLEWNCGLPVHQQRRRLARKL